MDLEHKAIARIQTASEMSLHHYGQPLVCTYSGGKDSDVMLELFRRAGVPFEVHHSHTTADAPQTVYHIRDTFRELELQGIKCNIDYHVQPDGSHITIWNLIPKKLMPPTRTVRYCCQILKETGCKNRMIATGVRKAESTARKGREAFEALGKTQKDAIRLSDEIMLLNDNDNRRRLIEKCELKAKTVVNPIIDWRDGDVWEYYQCECKRYNPLYDMGFMRVGCIGCPMAGKERYAEFKVFPKYRDAFMRAFAKMLEERKRRGIETTKWKSTQDVFDWWMEDENIDGQYSMDFTGPCLIGIKEKGG